MRYQRPLWVQILWGLVQYALLLALGYFALKGALGC